MNKKRNSFLNGLLWSSGGIGTAIPNTLIVTYLSFYATDVLGMQATLVATLLLVTKLLDGVTDLISGFVIDNLHLKWGKGRPYDLCIIFIGLFTVMMFAAPKSGTVIQAAYLVVTYILVQAVFVTLFHTANGVYLLHAFPEERERNNVFGISSVVGQIITTTAGVILPIFIAKAGTNHAEWAKAVAMIVIPTTIIGMIRFFFIREVKTDMSSTVQTKEEKAKKKTSKVGLKDGARAIFQNPYILILSMGIFIIVISSGFLNSAQIYYFQYVVGDMGKMAIAALGTYAALLMLVIFVPLANRVGKCNMMKFGLVVAIIGCMIRWIGGTNIVTITAGMGMLMFGVMPISAYFPLYLFDIMDYGEWKTGKRVEGVYAAFPTFANKVASGLAVSLGMFVLGAAGYDGSAAVQSESAIRAINLCYNAIPTLLIIFMTVILFALYNIDKKMPQVKENLEKRRKEAAQEQL